MNILFIGNSYTYYNDMPKIFENLANANGKETTVFSVTQSGRRLYQFTDKEDTVTKELDTLLRARKYGICFIQEQSLVPVQNSGFFISGLVLLFRKIKEYIPTVYLYETWGRKQKCEEKPEHWEVNPSMTKALATVYSDAAQMLKTKVSAVGDNFYNLHIAIPEIELYDPDGSHPSYKGSCLAALTHYYTAFGEFPDNTDSLQLDDSEIAAFKEVICK